MVDFAWLRDRCFMVELEQAEVLKSTLSCQVGDKVQASHGTQTSHYIDVMTCPLLDGRATSNSWRAGKSYLGIEEIRS